MTSSHSPTNHLLLCHLDYASLLDVCPSVGSTRRPVKQRLSQFAFQSFLAGTQTSWIKSLAVALIAPRTTLHPHLLETESLSACNLFLPLSIASALTMRRKRVKRSASQATQAPLSLPAPDRLSLLEQEPFDMICNHAVNEEKAFQNCPICALHCASKTLYIKTSAWVCKSGFMMTEYGLEALLRIARTPQATSRITHITLFFPDNENFYRWTTMDDLNRMVSRLNKCFARFNNLRTIELKPMTVLYDEEPENENSWVGPADHFKWSIKSLLDVLHTSGARITELIYDEGVHSWAWDQGEDVSEDDECVIYHPGGLSHAQMSCLHNIEKFRVVDSNVRKWSTYLSVFFLFEWLI